MHAVLVYFIITSLEDILVSYVKKYIPNIPNRYMDIIMLCPACILLVYYVSTSKYLLFYQRALYDNVNCCLYHHAAGWLLPSWPWRGVMHWHTKPYMGGSGEAASIARRSGTVLLLAVLA